MQHMYGVDGGCMLEEEGVVWYSCLVFEKKRASEVPADRNPEVLTPDCCLTIYSPVEL